MPIPLVNKKKHKEVFRLVENPKLKLFALVNEPPEEVRYSNNSIVRMIEVSGNAIDVKGKQIVSVSRSKALYLMGSFVLYREDKTYRAYEATHFYQTWLRLVQEIHPVTGLLTGKDTYETLKDVNIAILWDAKPPNQDDNPTQFLTIFSTDQFQPADIVGDFLIRETRTDYGLYISRAEFKVASK